MPGRSVFVAGLSKMEMVERIAKSETDAKKLAKQNNV